MNKQNILGRLQNAFSNNRNENTRPRGNQIDFNSGVENASIKGDTQAGKQDFEYFGFDGVFPDGYNYSDEETPEEKS